MFFDDNKLSNLLANAQKFTDKGTVDVGLKVTSMDDSIVTIELVVSDTGYDITFYWEEMIVLLYLF